MKPALIIVGGFLGVGKTSLILRASQILKACGYRVGMVLNDQGEDLVDTRLAQLSAVDVREVTGACFCCDFPSFWGAAAALVEAGSDIVLAEPVGSCTDLVATVIKPMDELRPPWRVAPVTVLVDPGRARSLLAPDAPSDLAYLFQTQIAEADLVIFSKSDICQPYPRLGVVGSVSAATGEGIGEWLDLVLGEHAVAGFKTVQVDYGRYGAAEAQLGWLNWSAAVSCSPLVTPLRLMGPFVDHVLRRLQEAGAAILHLKLVDEMANGYVRVSVCASDEEPRADGDLMVPPVRDHRLALNTRVACAPEVLSAVVEEAAATLAGDVPWVRQALSVRSTVPFGETA